MELSGCLVGVSMNVPLDIGMFLAQMKIILVGLSARIKHFTNIKLGIVFRIAWMELF
jgi:hypothetical protein